MVLQKIRARLRSPTVMSAPLRGLLVILAALVIDRLGRHILLPGLRPGLFVELSGGPAAALERLSIFSLGVTPIFSALLLCEVARLGSGSLSRWQHASRANARAFNVFVTLGALLITAMQGHGYARALENMPMLADEPGWVFRTEIIASFVAATAVLAWIGDIVSRGALVSGFWLLFVAPALAQVPWTLADSFALFWEGGIALQDLVIAWAFPVLAVLALVVAGQAGDRQQRPGGRRRRADFRLPAILDVWPPFLASATSGLIAGAIALALRDASWLALDAPLSFGQPLHVVLVATLIGVFTALRAPGLKTFAPVPAAPRQVWLTALAQIGICAASEILAVKLGLPFVANGPVLIAIVALALGLLSSWRWQTDLPVGPQRSAPPERP